MRKEGRKEGIEEGSKEGRKDVKKVRRTQSTVQQDNHVVYTAIRRPLFVGYIVDLLGSS